MHPMQCGHHPNKIDDNPGEDASVGNLNNLPSSEPFRERNLDAMNQTSWIISGQVRAIHKFQDLCAQLGHEKFENEVYIGMKALNEG